MKILILTILVFTLFGCNSYFKEVDDCFSTLTGNYYTINLKGNVLSDEVNWENKICLIYFFDSSCPSCWYKYEEISSYYANNMCDVKLFFFAFNNQPELVLKKQYENFIISSPVRLISKLPEKVMSNTIYFYYRKKVIMLINQSNNSKITKKDIENFF